MKNNLAKQTEELKKNVDKVSHSSKETIKTLIDSNTKQFGLILDANKKTFESISKLLKEKSVDPALTNAITSTFSKSIKLSEETIDSVIDSHSKRIAQSINFVSRFTEILKSDDITSKEGVSKLLDLAKDNLETSTALTMENIEKMVQAYSEHLNLALAFNRKFAENIQTYVNSLVHNQKRSSDMFPYGDVAFDWWKKAEEKEKHKA